MADFHYCYVFALVHMISVTSDHTVMLYFCINVCNARNVQPIFQSKRIRKTLRFDGFNYFYDLLANHHLLMGLNGELMDIYLQLL